MNKKNSLILLGVFLVLFVIFVVVDTKNSSSKALSSNSGSPTTSGANNTTSLDAAGTNSATQSDSNSFLEVTEAEQVIVVHFHGTNQCWSCVQLGELALATLEERFATQLEEEKVVFLEINGELPENREIVQLYQARGSSLFLNAIKDGENHIREEVKIWQLISQEEKFKDYLEKEISTVL